jgi:hypothetical protein
MEAPHGYAAITDKNKMTPRRLRELSYFAQFVDNGERGYVMAATVFWEFVGLLLSPVTVPLHGVKLLYRWSASSLWKKLENYENQLNNYLLKSFPDLYKNDTHIGGKQRNSGVVVDAGEEYDLLDLSDNENIQKLLQSKESLPKKETGNTAEQKIASSNHMYVINDDHSPLEKVGFSFLYGIKMPITSVLDMHREDTYLFNLFHNTFDPEAYSLTFLLVNRYYELMKLPTYIEIIIIMESINNSHREETLVCYGKDYPWHRKSWRKSITINRFPRD